MTSEGDKRAEFKPGDIIECDDRSIYVVLATQDDGRYRYRVATMAETVLVAPYAQDTFYALPPAHKISRCALAENDPKTPSK